MAGGRSPSDATPPATCPTIDEPPVDPDANVIRILPDPRATDEALAATARTALRCGGPSPIPAPPAVAPLLRQGEVVLAIHRCARVERRTPAERDIGSGIRGDLYLTSERLLLLAHPTIEVPLAAIRETGLAGERIILVHPDGLATAIDVETPRLLRVEIGAARQALRDQQGQPDDR